MKSLANLQNTSCLIPQQLRYSCWHDANKDCMDNGDGEHTMIDHILVSQGLFDGIKQVLPYHKYNMQCGEQRASDHWPVVVDIDVS
jgi:exonuclease III